MYKRLNLYKDKLPKIKRRTDDDDVYIRGMYHPFLDTKGYDVDVITEEGKTTAEKGVLADYPDFEGIGWIFDSEIRDYESLLKDRRNKMTQTFRRMLQQNSISSSSSSPPSSMHSVNSVLPNNINRSTSSSSEEEQQKSHTTSNIEQDDSIEEEEVSEKKSTPLPTSSSSSSRSSNPSLPVYPSVTPPVSVRSSPPVSIRSSPPVSVRSSPPVSVRSSNSVRPSTILSSSGSVASTIDYNFNQ